MKRLFLVLPLISGLLAVFPATTHTLQTIRVYPIPHGPFYVESYTGKCLTYGSGVIAVDFDDPSTPPAPPTAVYIDDCSDRAVTLPGRLLQQRIVVKEVNARHEVLLQAGTKVVGVMSNVLLAGVPLELQDYTGASGQFWVLDGDSLISKAERSLVAEVKNGRTPSGTRVELGLRDVDDAEFWTFRAVDGTNKKPTNGFVTVSDGPQLKTAADAASWGTVIEIRRNATIPLDDLPLQVKAGVTIRGDRRGTSLGPRLTLDSYPARYAIEIVGDYARVTGLRLRGPSPTKDKEEYSNGVYVNDDTVHWPIIDHNDISAWTEAAVHVNYYSDYDPATDLACDAGQPVRPRTVYVARNFLHHNAMDGLGYGVTVNANGFATIVGNTFLYNRHAIAGDGIRGTGYKAAFNLVLSDVPAYDWGITEHDFDMHGSDGGDHVGGIAGSDVDIAYNTFLGTNPYGPVTHYNYKVRGIPCGRHEFRRNISRQSQSEAIHWYGQMSPTAPPPSWLEVSDNQFNSPDPTRRLATGDFDGDGKPDLFLATGEAWYYSAGGLAEWRYINEQAAKMPNLLLGDVDGDGRTDVLTRQGPSWFVSWAGASRSEKINESDGATADFAIGDFDGNGRADIFYTDGSQWFVSYGATAPFTPLGYASAYRVANLRFGDFNADGRTDVFAVIGNGWYVKYGGSSPWSLLRSALATSIGDLLIADFNGDGHSDVALSNSSTWKVSFDGTGSWTELRSGGIALKDAAAVAPFDATAGVDALAWETTPLLSADSRYLDIVRAGGAAARRYSRNHMR